MILGGIILQGLFLSVIIFFNKQGDRLSKVILSSLIFAFSLMLVSEFIESTPFVDNHINISNAFFLLDLFLAPLTYLYAKVITQRKHLNPATIWAHLTLPFLANAVYLVYHSVTAAALHFINDPELEIYFLTLVYSKIAFQIIYQAASIFILSAAIRQHKKRPYEHATIHLIRVVRGILAIVFVLMPFVIALEDVYSNEMIDSDTVTNVIMIFSIYSIGYIALKNPLVYTREADFISKHSRVKNGGAGLPNEVIEKHVVVLKQLMEEKKPFIKPDLSLEDLAGEMSLSRHDLSQVLNDGLHQSFSDFVNSYRLRDFEDRITNGEHKHVNILAIGLESGFNSKATLYRAFKKQHGIAPKQFLQNLK